MIVTKISAQQKDTNRVNVFIDSKYTCSLTLDQLLAEKLKVGAQVASDDVKHLCKVSEDGKLRARALEWLLVRPRSSSELKLYLAKKKASPELVAAITKEFSEKGYQDDTYFTQWWVEQRTKKNKSDLAIRAELLQKGIPSAIIAEAMQGSTTQIDRLRELVKRKGVLAKYQQDPLKFKKYLLSKGFRYSEIDEVLAEDSGEDDNF